MERVFHRLSSPREIFQSLYPVLGLDLAFNIVLVHQDARPCCLLERANYIMTNDIDKYSAAIKFCQEELPKYGLNTYLSGEGLFICGSALPNKRAPKTNQQIGKALGFDCPDQMDGHYGVGYFVSLGTEEESFYAEICKEFDSEKVASKLKKFQKVANQLNMTIRLVKHTIWKTPRLIEVLKSADPITREILFEIANAFWNAGLHQSVGLIEQLGKQKLKNYRNTIQKYIPIWLVLLPFSEHNPFLIFQKEINNQLIDKTWDDVFVAIGEWEQALYQD